MMNIEDGQNWNDDGTPPNNEFDNHDNFHIQDPYQNNQNTANNNSEIVPSENDEQVSVYMKDNMIMRRIQIEGDDREFLMDPNGQIYDMMGQFIGTANTNELEELQDENEAADDGLN